MSLNSNQVPGDITRMGGGGLDISLGYRYPEMFCHLITGHVPALGTGASSGKTIQNDPAVSHVGPSLTPAVATLTSDDVNDTLAGTGAQLVLVSGVNSDGYLTSEVVSMDGANGADTISSYYVVGNAIIIQEGAAGQQGDIVVSINGSSQGAIIPELKALLTGHIMVPINYWFYPMHQVQSATSNVNISSVIQFNVLGGGESGIVGNVLHNSNSAHSLIFEAAPFPSPPGTYTRYVAKGNSGDGATVYLAGLMVHSDLMKDIRGHTIAAPPGTIYDVASLS